MEEFKQQQQNEALTEVTDNELGNVTGGVTPTPTAEITKAVYQGFRADGRGKWHSATAAHIIGPKAAKMQDKFTYIKPQGLAEHVKDTSKTLREHNIPLFGGGKA